MTDLVPSPSLTRVSAPPRTRAAVLVLHGGQQHGDGVVDRRNASWWRARVLAAALAPALRSDGVSVHLLRYRRRGWNDGSGPVEDARWGLEQVRRRVGAVPVALLGHSMGARTAVGVADDPLVRGVVALAPWFPPGEPVDALTGRVLLAAHARGDRVTSYAATRAYVARASRVATRAELEDMGDLGHYLLRGARRWDRFALESCRAVLAEDPVAGG